MADDFHTRLAATLASIPKPPPANFIRHVFRDEFPSLDNIRCFKQALRRCLEGGELGWLIWDQVAEWPVETPSTTLWTDLIAGVRHLIALCPPWLVLTTAEARRQKNRRSNRDMAIDQNCVAMMQSRIKQWLAKCYLASLSNPSWETTVSQINANKATRFRIMQKAKNAGLIPEINQDMINILERREPPSEQVVKEQRARMQRLRKMRAQRQQQATEEAWRTHRRQSRGIED